MTEEAGVVINKSTRSVSGLVASQGIEFFMILGIGVIVAIWIFAIIRVARDIMARTNSLGLQILALLMITIGTPIIGLPLYLAIRPIGFKYDRMPWREAAVMNLVVCYNCATLNPRDHECCLACGESLKIKCKQCGKNYPHSYGYCSHCGAPNID